MNIINCTSKKEWNNALISLDKGEFLQSWEWGEFQKGVGHAPVRLFLEKTPIQGFTHKLPLGFSFVYFPRTTTLNKEQIEGLSTFLKNQGYVFARIEPAETKIKTGEVIKCRQPQTTLQLDITKSEEELLAAMHSKTRYNIRLAQKKGVTISNKKNIDVFWELNTATTQRDSFKSHDKEYYKKMFELDMVQQFTAYDSEQEALATIICISFNRTFIYLHGASSNKNRNLMAPYLLQWHAMVQAKNQGSSIYDFWGVAPQGDNSSGAITQFNGFTWQADHPWTGVTRFKVGFGGKVIAYPYAVELPLKKILYKTIQLIKKIQ